MAADEVKSVELVLTNVVDDVAAGLDDVEIKSVVETDSCVVLLDNGNWVASIELPVTVVCCGNSFDVVPKEDDKEVKVVASVTSEVDTEMIV